MTFYVKCCVSGSIFGVNKTHCAHLRSCAFAHVNCGEKCVWDSGGADDTALLVRPRVYGGEVSEPVRSECSGASSDNKPGFKLKALCIISTIKILFETRMVLSR